MSLAKKYDVILYGASGFTGKQTVKYFMDNAPETLNWAIAGRNEAKLKAVKNELETSQKQIDIIVADSRDSKAIESLVQQTRIVLTTAGPFSWYGELLIANCAKHGVDYLDITGEVLFSYDMMKKHEGKAKASGAKIISFCGFDSVPFDIGSFAVTQYIEKTLNKKTKSIDAFISANGGFLNGGTYITVLEGLETKRTKELNDPSLLVLNNSSGINILPDRNTFFYESSIKKWVATFPMAIINTRVVNRSASLYSSIEKQYGDKFEYREWMQLGSFWNPLAAIIVANSLKIGPLLKYIPGAVSLLRKIGPSASDGPSEKVMDNGFYSVKFKGIAEDGTQVNGNFSGKGDPNNRATVMFACESALSLALHREELPGGPERSGFITPAFALGNVLMQRLKNAGVTIDVDTV